MGKKETQPGRKTQKKRNQKTLESRRAYTFTTTTLALCRGLNPRPCAENYPRAGMLQLHQDVSND